MVQHPSPRKWHGRPGYISWPKTVPLTQPSQQAVQVPHCRAPAAVVRAGTRLSGTTAPQHFLYFFPLPQGQGSFLPTVIASAETGNPAFHAGEILAVGISEKRREARLVIAHAPMEPDEVKREHDRSDPRVQREHDPGKKNQVPEIHRIPAVAVRPADHESLRRNREPGPAAAFARAVVADEAVLQVAPCEQRQRPQIDWRQAALQRGLGAKERERPGDKRAVRGAAQPPRGAGTAHAVAASVLGMNRMKRFAATIVPARKVNVAGRPKLSATSPPRSGPIDEPRACAPNSTP